MTVDNAAFRDTPFGDHDCFGTIDRPTTLYAGFKTINAAARNVEPLLLSA